MGVRSVLLSALPHSEKHQQARGGDEQRRASRVRASLRNPTRRIGGYAWVYGEARRALLRLPPVVTRGLKESRWALTQLGAAHPPTPPQQTHPQNSRYTPRCPSVVLWTPCSGCGDAVPGACSNRPSGPTATTQAACEPAGGECGGVPVHPPRRHTHRTSPAQALLTMLIEAC
jgi:hypothetical protein